MENTVLELYHTNMSVCSVKVRLALAEKGIEWVSHLVDLRFVSVLPPTVRIEGVLVVSPAELVAGKVIAFTRRRGQPKSGTDWRDIAALLLRFPELKVEDGAVFARLQAVMAEADVIATWRELCSADIVPEADDDL